MEDFRQLRKLGLSPGACHCYLTLLAELPHALQAKHIKALLPLADASLYRAINELHEKGFIETFHIIGPKRYRAIDLSPALDSLALYQRAAVLPLLQKLHATKLSQNFKTHP